MKKIKHQGIHFDKHSLFDAQLAMAAPCMVASGTVQCAKVNAKTGRVILWYPPQKNLIMNAGMELVATDANSWGNLFGKCKAGTGTTPTKDSSGAITGSQTGTTFTASSPIFTDTGTDAGKMIKMTSGADTGVEVRIVTVTSTTIAEVTPSRTTASGTFDIYRTNQTALTTTVKTYNAYLTGSGNCDTTTVGAVTTMKRTYDFTAEVGGVTYTEVGFMRTSDDVMLSRILLASPVGLVAGQALRVVYSLAITMSPTSATVVNSPGPITGWTTSGFKAAQCVGFAGVDTNGNSSVTGGGLGRLNLPTDSGSNSFISPDSTALVTYNTTPPARNTNHTLQTWTPQTYTALSFTRDKNTVFGANDANRNDLRSLGTGSAAGSLGAQGFVYVMDANQTKDNLHTLTISIRISWGRTLA